MFFLSENFPPKIEYNLQAYLDCRVKLYAREQVILQAGEQKAVMSNVFVLPGHHWQHITTKGNPNLPFHYEDQLIRSLNCRQQIFLTIINLANEKRIIPAGCLIGYAILK